METTHRRSQIHVRGKRRFSVQRLLATVLALGLLGFGTVLPVSAQDPPAASITVTPEFGDPGTQIEIAGSGFVGECGARLWLGEPDGGYSLGQVFLGTDGSFDADFTIPEDADAGSYDVVAQGLAFGGEFCSGPTGTEARVAFRVSDGDPDLEPRFVPRKPERTVITEGFSRTEAHLKFHQDTQVRVRDGEFASLGEDDLSALHAVFAGFPDVTPSRLFDARSEEEHARDKAIVERQSGREQGDKNLYFLLTYPETTDAEELIDALNALDIVELAYPDPLPGEDPTNHTDDLRPLQGYRTAAPGGIHADAAGTIAGGRGENVQIIDIERFFNPDHEDLPPVTVYPNGDPMASFSAPFDHGTAVLGQIFGMDNGFGVLGLADQAAAGFVSSAGGRPNAIDVAAANSAPGDVILLELQRGGPNGTCSNATTPPQFGCVPEEFVQASYDAIVSATAAGIIVVAAAGNGFQDLDGEEYDDTLGDRPDSGAIIVGAGAPEPDSGVHANCNAGGEPRERLDFSNFGSRVDVHGWGRCVATTGYGQVQGSPDSDDAYTGLFSGTSSASPIVASAAGILSSVAIAQGNANGLTSTAARAVLMATGSPQNTGPGTRAGNIGPLPNLAAALGLAADLAVTKTAAPEPVAAGEDLTYTITVTNNGPNVATDVEVLDELPAEVAFLASDPACDLLPSGDLLCVLGQLAAGASTGIEVDVHVPHHLVYEAGGPVTVTNTASVTSTIDDPVGANNSASVDSTAVAVADLEVVTVDVLDVPTEALVGQDIAVTLHSDVRNLGPSWPIDALLDTTGTPSAGASVAPANLSTPVAGLAINSLRTVERAFTIRCDEPGQQQVVFDVEISPANAEDTDPDPGNDVGQAVATLECVLPIAINIRPGHKHNLVQPGVNGVVPVAALTTAAGEYGLLLAFDATSIVTSTVRFGEPGGVWAGTSGAPTQGPTHVRDAHELDDLTKDGDLDLVMAFRISSTGISAGDGQACMRGLYEDGGQLFSFVGCDVVQTIP